MINSVLKLPHSKFRFNWTNISSFVPEFLRWGVSRDHSRPLPVRVFFFFFFASQPPVSVLHNFVDGRGGGRGKDNRSRRNERLCPRCPWLSAVFCQQSLSWQLYGKRSGNLFNVFLYKKIDFLISKDIFWYQKIDFSIFWYQKIFFDIKISIFLYQKLIFWYQKLIFWYQKIFSDIKNIFDIKNGNLFWYQKVSLIFWYQKMNFWYQKIQNKFPLRTLFFYIKNIE